MATPHVAGLIAYLIRAEGNLPPAAVIKKIQDYSVKGALSNMLVGEYQLLRVDNKASKRAIISYSHCQLLGTEQTLRTEQKIPLLWNIPLPLHYPYNNACNQFTRLLSHKLLDYITSFNGSGVKSTSPETTSEMLPYTGNVGIVKLNATVMQTFLDVGVDGAILLIICSPRFDRPSRQSTSHH